MQPDESPKHTLWRTRADLPLLALSAVGFGVEWYARNGMTASAATMAALIGLGQTVGYFAVILFIMQLVRRQMRDAR